MKYSMNWRRGRMILIILMILIIIVPLLLDQMVERSGEETLVNVTAAKPAEAILILGAYVKPNGEVSRMLKDRLDYGYALYKNGKSDRIIVSGDHGTVSYNEVKAMCEYLEEKGVPSEAIFMDHAGFSTYDSIYRMKAIFGVTDAIIVSQKYHVVRAAYISKNLGVSTQSVASDTYIYEKMLSYRIREIGARIKAFVMASILVPEPKYLGEKISINGSGLKTRD